MVRNKRWNNLLRGYPLCAAVTVLNKLANMPEDMWKPLPRKVWIQTHGTLPPPPCCTAPRPPTSISVMSTHVGHVQGGHERQLDLLQHATGQCGCALQELSVMSSHKPHVQNITGQRTAGTSNGAGAALDLDNSLTALPWPGWRFLKFQDLCETPEIALNIYSHPHKKSSSSGYATFFKSRVR